MSKPPRPRYLSVRERVHENRCPQRGLCWGPWILDSDTDSICLYEEQSGTGMRIGLWPGGPPAAKFNPALEAMAFLVHIQWAGPWFTSGLLNAYSSIYGLTGYEPALAEMACKKADIKGMVAKAVSDPVNLWHVWSLADTERFIGHEHSLESSGSMPADIDLGDLAADFNGEGS
jgi:hypothetical protein